MKTISIWLLLVASCLSQDIFDTTVTVKQQPTLVAISGESAITTQEKDRVVVVISKSNKELLSIVDIAIETKATRYNLAVTDSSGKRLPVTRSKEDGSFRLMAKAGRYNGTIILLDEEFMFDKIDMPIVVGDGVVPPPDNPPPPVTGLDDLRKVSKEKAVALNDPATAKVLSGAYKASLPMIAGKTLAESQAIVKQLRFNVLTNRPKPIKADWNSWLVAVDAEVVKYVGDSQERYKQAITAIAESLE